MWIWATAPFLHNGSVPSLYELLKPGTVELLAKISFGDSDFSGWTGSSARFGTGEVRFLAAAGFWAAFGPKVA